jgi:hypothetical protein
MNKGCLPWALQHVNKEGKDVSLINKQRKLSSMQAGYIENLSLL